MTSRFELGRSRCLSPEGMRAPKCNIRTRACIHATKMRGDESERSVASVAVRVTSERGRMHERDGNDTVI